MTRAVVFSPEAQDDLRQLSLYIAERSGAARAIAYLDRIEGWCLGLGGFPERGARRDDLWPGLRTMGFERRVTIAFTVTAGVVTILRVLSDQFSSAYNQRPNGPTCPGQPVTDDALLVRPTKLIWFENRTLVAMEAGSGADEAL